MPRLLLAAAVLVVAALLRVASAQSGGLWLDEIWSLQLAENLASPFDVLSIRQDNNHPLNTLVLSLLVGDRGPDSFFLFRTPAVVAGILATAVAGAMAKRRGNWDALTAMLLVGSSSLLVHYSSEARGYSFAVLFALTSWFAISRDDRNAGWCALFNVSIGLGMLSHLSFVHVYGAILLWWLYANRRESIRSAGTEFVRWHGLPLLMTLVLYFIQARDLPVAGGPDAQLARLLARSGAMAIGLAGSGSWRWIGGGLALAIAILCIGRLARHSDDRWVFFASGIFLLPLATLLVGQPEFLAPRYFLMSILLFLLLIADGLAALLSKAGATRWLGVCLLLAFVVGNGLATRSFLQHGRGQYWKALAYMANRSGGPVLQVGSDHDIRVGVVIGFYGRILPKGKQLAYHRQEHWPPGGPQWLVRHRHGRLYPIEESIAARGNSYRLAHVFPTGPLSGSHWIVYHNEALGPAAQ